MGGRQGEGGPGDILSFFFYTHTMTPTFVFHHEILVLGDKIQLRTPPQICTQNPKSSFKFNLDLIFQGHLTHQSRKTCHFQKLRKNNHIN